ncbi:hypothetical protein CONPUDRAFT_168578 [Coniophora puteana RWD-64-598 SS2]|uniref:SMP domain-containing protein n=1 Tax=Coniophora puteana (strain RWD-64-598) TaxID=741705 RepID=A0A5M3MDZ1_CONPW|nr:uncharacterized protein CONPUDRAFT_168578 [Coniophora puteana RWD-64-598 SS2]EIW76835.1 hypothetical protein CONPUDRAFT_168578 [Coniophora puteana RWD-64-598 SS2]
MSLPISSLNHGDIDEPVRATVRQETTTVTVETAPASAVDAIDFNNMSEDDARRLMSKEHKELGYRPPPGSLAAQAQAAAAKQSGRPGLGRLDSELLNTVAREDAELVRARTEGASGIQGVDITDLAEGDARKLVSVEHRALGYNPPRGSLAAEAQRHAAKHPSLAGRRYDSDVLTQAALNDAIDVEERQPRGAERTEVETVRVLGNTELSPNVGFEIDEGFVHGA